MRAVFLLSDAFLAERDAHSVRDAGFARDVRLRRVGELIAPPITAQLHHLSLIRSAYEGTDIISYLSCMYIIRQSRISYRVAIYHLCNGSNSYAKTAKISFLQPIDKQKTPDGVFFVWKKTTACRQLQKAVTICIFATRKPSLIRPPCLKGAVSAADWGIQGRGTACGG